MNNLVFIIGGIITDAHITAAFIEIYQQAFIRRIVLIMKIYFIKDLCIDRQPGKAEK